MAFDAHANFALSTVATPPTPATSGTSLVVAAGTGTRFPTPPFNVTIWPANALASATNAEIARVTAKTTDTLTITRAQESTTARTVLAGDQIMAGLTVKTITDLETSLVPAGSVTNTQTTLVHDWTPVSGTGDAYVVWAGAADLGVTGIVARTVGSRITLLNLAGGPILSLYPANTGSAAANRMQLGITNGPTMIGNRGTVTLYYSHAGYWQLVSHDQGAWFNIPFSASNFTGYAPMTWTVASGNVNINKCLVSGHTLFWTFSISGSVLGGSPSTLMFMTPPLGYTFASGVMLSGGIIHTRNDGGQTFDNPVRGYTFSGVVNISRVDGTAFQIISGVTDVYGTMAFELV